MYRSLSTLLACLILLQACASDKDETKKDSGPSQVASPMDTLATPKEMVPVVVPLPVKPGDDGTKLPAPVDPKPLPEPQPEPQPLPEPEPEPQPLPEPEPEPQPQPRPEPRPEPQPRPNPTWDESLRAAQRRAQNVKLACEGGKCHQSVGLVSIVNKEENGWGAGQCTGSLVAPDVVVTNGHCIPLDLKEPGADCRGRLWITFGDDAGLDKQLACSKVLFRKKDTSFDGADYAFFQLEKRSNRPVLRHSREGIEANKQYFLHKVNPTRAGSDAIGGNMEKVGCKAIHDSVLFENLLDRQSQSVLFVDCLVVPGNSGSPILADDGTVRGVIYAFVRPDKVQQMLDRNGSQLPSIQQLSPLNMGSNFACLQDPATVGGRPLPAACNGQAERLREAKRQHEARLVAKLQPQAQRLIQNQQGSRTDIKAFGWTVRTSSTPTTGRVALGYPECVRASNASPLLDRKSNLHRPFFFIKAKYTRYLQPSNETLVWAGFADTVESVHLAKEGAGYRVQITDPASSQLELNAAIGACGGK